MTFQLIPRGVQIILIALVLGAAIYDILYRRIPNWMTVSGAAMGVALNSFLVPAGWAGLRYSAAGLGLGFAVYFVLYLLRAKGAGDVKLMAAIGALAGPRDWFGIFLLTSILGGVLALALAATRGRVRKTMWNVAFIFSEMRRGRPAYVGKEELDVNNPQSLRLPGGAVTALGTLLFLGIISYLAR